MSSIFSLATNIRRFRPKNRSRRKLPFPAKPTERIAQVSFTSKPFDLCQTFPRLRWNDLPSFRPQVLVGSASDLLRLHHRSQLEDFDLKSIDHTVFVLTQCGHNALNDVARVSLWQAFGVPLFELFISSRGRVLASECEAHEGWHVEPGNDFSVVEGKLFVDEPTQKNIQTGLTANLDHTLCPCGRETLRLVDIDGHAAWAVQQQLRLAATA